MINTSTLRPGLLVGLSTTLRGNVKYRTQILEEEHLTESGAEAARWETERVITDPVEFESAKKARSKARNAIVRVCSASAFGLLCPEDKVADLEAGLAEARTIADKFNASATTTRLGVNVLTGRIAADDVEAVKAINSEVRDLLSQIERGIQKVDVKAIRDAADAAKNLGQMLAPDAAERVQKAIEIARSEARRLVKAGEQAAAEIDQAALARITEARVSFLDLDEAKEIAAPVETGLGLDLMPEEAAPAAVAPITHELEI
jgi:hypothetical protein